MAADFPSAPCHALSSLHPQVHGDLFQQFDEAKAARAAAPGFLPRVLRGIVRQVDLHPQRGDSRRRHALTAQDLRDRRVVAQVLAEHRRRDCIRPGPMGDVGMVDDLDKRIGPHVRIAADTVSGRVHEESILPAVEFLLAKPLLGNLAMKSARASSLSFNRATLRNTGSGILTWFRSVPKMGSVSRKTVVS